MTAKLTVINVYKVFGDTPEEGLRRVKAGESKEKIFEETGNTVGVQNVSFEVGEGDIFVVMGLSGSGKSTLVRMLNGLIAPTDGQVFVDEDEITNSSPGTIRKIRREKIAMVFQHFALFPHMSVADNTAFGLKVKGIDKADRRKLALEALDQVGLSANADSLPSELSGGMQQRVGLARGLAADPDILLMDEPFSALDPLIRRDMQEELLTLQRELKKTIIFITHDLNEALFLGDKIAIMKNGRFVQVGTAEEIVANPADEYVSAFVADIDRSRVFTVRHVANHPAPLKLGTDTAETALRKMEDLNRNALYVLDGEKIAGVVTYQDLTTVNRGEEGETKLTSAMTSDYPHVLADDQLYELYGPASLGLPIAVIDHKQRLVGVVEPEDVFAQLSGEEQSGSEAAPNGKSASVDAR